MIKHFTYTLDADGNRTRVVGTPAAQSITCTTRSAASQITDAVAGNRAMDYTYDPVGNRLSLSDSGEGLTQYTYDANDRLLTETLAGDVTGYTYDNNGNMLSKIRNTTDRVFYNWNCENQLIAADTDGDGTADVTYKYDADGNRVTTNGQETRFLVDASGKLAQVVEEYTPGGSVIALCLRQHPDLPEPLGGEVVLPR